MQQAFTLIVNMSCDSQAPISMTTTTLRHHSATLSFLPMARARQMESLRRDVRILFSQRRFKRIARGFLIRREA